MDMFVNPQEKQLAKLNSVVITDKRIYHFNTLGSGGMTTIDLRSVSSVEYGMSKKWIFIILAVFFALLPIISVIFPQVSFLITGIAAGVLFLLFIAVFFMNIKSTLVITYDSKSFTTIQKGVSKARILEVRNSVFNAKDAVLRFDGAPLPAPPQPVNVPVSVISHEDYSAEPSSNYGAGRRF